MQPIRQNLSGRIVPALVSPAYGNSAIFRKMRAPQPERAGSYRKSGFSLVEVVVATALLGIGIAACVACIGSATRASSKAETLTAVQWLAQEKLSELRLQPVEEGEHTGDFGTERAGYRWRTVATKTNTSGLLQVQLQIAWDAPNGEQSAGFVTYARSRPRRVDDQPIACSACHADGIPRQGKARK